MEKGWFLQLVSEPVYDNSGPVPQLQNSSSEQTEITFKHNSLSIGIHDHGNEPSSSNLVPIVSTPADIYAPSQQELDLLFGPLYDEFFTAGTSSVNNSSSPTDNSTQQDKQPTTNVKPTTEPITPTINVHAEKNIHNQAA
ncbi:hypothetical protein Tco_1414631 [Tanacetum coccineum]